MTKKTKKAKKAKKKKSKVAKPAKKSAVKKTAAKSTAGSDARVAKNKVVTLHYSVRDESKKLVESSIGEEPLTYLHGHGEIISGLEKGMLGKKSGDKFSLKIGPKDGYGLYNKTLLLTVGIEKFSGQKNPKVGDIFKFGESEEEGRYLRVTQVDKKQVTLDGNHPFAGKTLNFQIDVLEIRDATPSELEHKHAHPPGHHH